MNVWKRLNLPEKNKTLKFFWHTFLTPPSYIAKSIPDICHFWYTVTQFRLVKNTRKKAEICEKIAKAGQNAKKYTTAGGIVVTNISCD